jgi:hypothetical protein
VSAKAANFIKPKRLIKSSDLETRQSSFVLQPRARRFSVGESSVYSPEKTNEMLLVSLLLLSLFIVRFQLRDMKLKKKFVSIVENYFRKCWNEHRSGRHLVAYTTLEHIRTVYKSVMAKRDENSFVSYTKELYLYTEVTAGLGLLILCHDSVASPFSLHSDGGVYFYTRWRHAVSSYQAAHRHRSVVLWTLPPVRGSETNLHELHRVYCPLYAEGKTTEVSVVELCTNKEMADVFACIP